MPCDFYFRSVARRWKKDLKQAVQRVVICSPYLSPRTAESVIGSAPVANCEVYTRFSVEDFASGASSIRTIRRIHEAGYKLFEIPLLHAKVVLVSGEFVSIGSQNVTANGVRNREATCISTDPEDVAVVEASLELWLAHRRPITMEMIEDVEAILPPISKIFREAQKLADEAEASVRKRMEEREAARLLEEQHRAAAIAKRNALIATARSSIEQQLPEGKVPFELAWHFIWGSTWWHSHSSGRPVRARRHAKYIKKGLAGDWRIKFGNNWFLVGRAIERCTRTLEKYLGSIEEDNAWTQKNLMDKLCMDIRGAVATGAGWEYNGFYPLEGQDMMFGVTSIDVKDFVSLALQFLPQELRQLPVQA